MTKISVTPDPFTLVPYDVDEIRALVEEAAALAEISPGVDIALTVDEELFAPLTGHMSDVVDGRVVMWISGGNFEDNKRPCHFSADQARVDLAVMMLRAKDRLSDDFATAPPDADLSRGERHPLRVDRAWCVAGAALLAVRGRAGPTARPRRQAPAPALRLPAPARFRRRGRRRVRAVLGRRARHLGRPA